MGVDTGQPTTRQIGTNRATSTLESTSTVLFFLYSTKGGGEAMGNRPRDNWRAVEGVCAVCDECDGVGSGRAR